MTRSSVLALIATGCLALPAAAQDGVIEEVIVTAQKRAQSQQDVPASIATLSGERLDVIRSAGADIRFLSNRVPSLQIESSFGRTFPRFYIRGLGNTDFDLNASQPVALVYDDVVLENPILKGFPAFDLDRIEILRGPQGTLFGRNTPAGIVKFESARPTQELEGYSRLSYGRFNQFTAETALSGPLISDLLSARLSVLYQRRDDYIDNFALDGTVLEEDAFEGYDEFAGRLQFLLEPTDNFSALFNVHGRYLDGTARVFRANIVEPGTDDIAQASLGTFLEPQGAFVPFDRQRVFHDGQNFQTANTIGGVATLEYVSDSLGLVFKSVTAYESAGITTRGDIDGGTGAAFLGTFGPGFIPFPSETSDILDEHRQFTEEVLISSDEWGLFDFQLGFFYFDEELGITTLNFDTLSPGAPVNGIVAQDQDSRSIAVFANINLELTDQLTLEGGVRYSDDERDLTAELIQSPIGAPTLVGDEAVMVDTDADPIAWDVSATYFLNDDINLFARIARSFRAPSIQARQLFAFPVVLEDGSLLAGTTGVSVADTEFIISYEAGIKADLFDRRARVNLTGFFYDLDDQQVTAVGGTTNIATLVNVEDSDGVGFELEIEAAPTENLFFTAGISFNSTEFNDPNLAIPTCGGGCTPTDPLAVIDPNDPTQLIASPDGTIAEGGELAIVNGNPFPQAPEWIVAWTLRYGLPVGDAGEVFVFTDWNYRSRVNFFLYESLEFTDGGLVEGGVRIGYTHNQGQWEIAAFGRNILNDVSRTGGIDFNNLTGFVNEPPVWGIDLTYNFP